MGLIVVNGNQGIIASDLSHSRIRECKIDEIGDKSWQKCPNCRSWMLFVTFFKKNPPIVPKKSVFCTKLDDWN
jgi:hypothetical protein